MLEALTPATWAILITFVIGYCLIIFEHKIHINKATSALLTAVVMWAIVFASPHAPFSSHLSFLREQLSEITQVVLFLIAALTIVEIIAAHQGFGFVSRLMKVDGKRRYFWIVGILTFFLSAILDNLTTTIVMVTLVAKVVPHRIDRWIIGSGVVIAANAGGAWTPIGDVTTTMLWIGGQLSAANIITNLFIPSVVCMAVSFLFLTRQVEGRLESGLQEEQPGAEPHAKTILFIGIGALIFIPIFKTLTGLPPFMGALFGLSLLWAYTDIAHFPHKERGHLRVTHIIRSIDLSSVLFFLGVLLAVGALDEANILSNFALLLNETIANHAVIAALIGVLSAIVDNVPLVAAAMGMYDFSMHPPDSPFWELIAFCAGTGGSMLIIGSAAGVVFMGIEKVDFFWYFKKVTFSAALGYAAGLAAYLLVDPLLNFM